MWFQDVCLDILDTAGQEEYSSVRDQYMRYGDGFVMVYSSTDRVSFDQVEALYELVVRIKDGDSVPMVCYTADTLCWITFKNCKNIKFCFYLRQEVDLFVH